MAQEFTTDSFTSAIGSDATVLVDFYSETCGPCKRLAPVIDELASENDGNAKVGKFNVAEDMDLAVKYGIAAVPTILVFKGGEVVERATGYKEKGDLQAMIDNHKS